MLDVNESSRIPLHLRYDLRSPTPGAAEVPALEPDRSPRRITDADGPQVALEKAKAKFGDGEITPNTYKELETSLQYSIDKPRIELVQLDTTPHTTLESVIPNELPSDLDEDIPTGYLSPHHEAEFLLYLDNTLSNGPAGLRSVVSSQLAKANDRERERDSQLRNPVSVHNWLRKNHHLFLQHDDSNPDKSSSRQAAKVSPKPPNPTKVTKRSSVMPKQEHEMIDDEGFLIGVNMDVPSKNKRKREDEPYRPKGGSSRPAKKKRTMGGAAKKTIGDDDGI